jgi:phosphatidylserine decarboxylase
VYRFYRWEGGCLRFVRKIEVFRNDEMPPPFRITFPPKRFTRTRDKDLFPLTATRQLILVPVHITSTHTMQFATGSRRFVLPPLVLSIPTSLVFPPLGAALLLGGLFSMWFFRDPARATPDGGVVSPADGKVSVVREEGDRVRVGVYMSAVDVHVNRAPLSGTVESVTHRPGAHRPAFSKESERNERVDVTIRGDDGEAHEVSLIAGWFARRIHPYVSRGNVIERGDRIGHIDFGSRADVLLPSEYDRDDVRVRVGERVTAGESIVADRR